MKKFSFFLISFSILGHLHSEDVLKSVIGPFGTLSNYDSSLIIAPEKAQDLLNVDISPQGKSVKKREGFAQAVALTITTAATHGVFKFFDSSGNEVALIFNDSRLSSSINGANPTQLFNDGPLNATYQCVDSQGFAYCNNSSRTRLIKTDGVTVSSVTNVNSTGTMVAITPDRLITSGFAGSPNRIDFSASADFTRWIQPFSAGTDPNQITITAPGSRITHIVYAFGRLIWFKDNSFGYILFGQNLLDWKLVTVSPVIGSLDNTSIYWNDVLYWRAQDGHFYSYDGSNIERMSRDITDTILTLQNRLLNSWTQTTQAEFETGFSSADITTSQLPGSVMAKTTSYIYTTLSTPTFSGSTQYVDTFTASGFISSLWPDPFDVFSSTRWTKGGLGGTPPTTAVSGSTLTITLTTNGSEQYIASQRSSHLFSVGTTYYSYFTGVNNTSPIFVLVDVLTTSGDPAAAGNYWQMSFTSCGGGTGFTAAQSNSKGDSLSSISTCQAFPLEVSLWLATTTYRLTLGTATVAGSHTMTNAKFYSYIGLIGGTAGSANVKVSQFSVAPQTFTFISGTMDTGIVFPVWSTFTAVYSGNGIFSSTSSVSSDDVTYDAPVAATFGSVIASAAKRYIRTTTLFNQNLSSGTQLSANYNVISGSSGSYLSAVHNSPSLTSWDAFAATVITNDGTQNFSIRSSSNSFTVQSSTPSWVSVANGGIPTVSTGTNGVYFQIRDSLKANSSGTVRMDDFTQNWFEGNASDKIYGGYFDYALWWNVQDVNATYNNKIIKYDMLNNGFTLYDIPMNGFYVKNGSLYFGSSNGGYVYKYGGVDNDNGSAINSYWKSKDFINGEGPFNDDEFVQLSLLTSSVQNSSMTVTYTIDGSTSTSFTMPLDAGNSSFRYRNMNLPTGRIGTTFNLQFGNNASNQPFEVFAVQYGYREKPWIPKN